MLYLGSTLVIGMYARYCIYICAICTRFDEHGATISSSIYLGTLPQVSASSDRPGSRHGDDSLGFQKGLYSMSLKAGSHSKPFASP